MAQTADFFTAQSLGTFAGASGAVVLVTNTFRKLSGKDSVWIPFVVALGAAYAAAAITGGFKHAYDYLLVLLNGCLLFCTALGIQEGLVSAKEGQVVGQPKLQGGRQLTVLSSWLRR